MSHCYHRFVFFLPGFDPRGASFYHQLFKDSASDQGQLRQINYVVDDRKRLSSLIHQWKVSASSQSTCADTVVTHFSWDDIVRAYWPKGLLSVLRAFVALLPLHYFGGGVLRIKRLGAKGPFYSALIPMLVILCAAFLGLLVLGLLHTVGAPLLVGMLVSPFVFFLTLKVADRLKVFWLLRIYHFVALWGWRKVPELDARLERWSLALKAALADDDTDEVIFVGHSIGVLLLIDVLSRLPLDANTQKLKVLSLGHSVPLMVEMPAPWFKEKVDRVSRMNLSFYDVTAAMDGASFYGVSPLYSAKKDTAQCYSARFFDLFSDESYSKIRRDPYRMHFQYFHPTEKVGLMDFPWLVFSPGDLEDKFEKYPEARIDMMKGVR